MLNKYISELGNSRPIFKLNVAFKKDRVNSTIVKQYVPEIDPNDSMSSLLSHGFCENLRGDKFVKDYDQIKKNVATVIKSEMKKFIQTYGGYKNAKQSAIFRFMSMYNTTDPVLDGLVYLYKYSRSLKIANSGSPTDAEQKHIDNILAIIELMRSKFES